MVTVSLADALGRVLVEPRIRAPIDVPAFASSAMDGYAVRAAETPGDLRVVTERQDLKEARFAGVNAAGAGGTHYHVVLEAGPDAVELSP